MPQPDSHPLNKAGLKVPAVHFQVFSSSISSLFSLFLPPSAHLPVPPPLSHFLYLSVSLFFSPSSGSVPTVPPGNVQAEAVNSTTVRFTWSAPSPQFINGINQGYKVSGPFLSTGAL